MKWPGLCRAEDRLPWRTVVVRFFFFLSIDKWGKTREIDSKWQEVRDNTKNDLLSAGQGILKAWDACLSCLNHHRPVRTHTNTPQWQGTHYLSLQPTTPAPKSSWPLKILPLESQISSCKLHMGSWSHVPARFWPDWQAETLQEDPMFWAFSTLNIELLEMEQLFLPVWQSTLHCLLTPDAFSHCLPLDLGWPPESCLHIQTRTVNTWVTQHLPENVIYCAPEFHLLFQ